jgi:hypothetical protein
VWLVYKYLVREEAEMQRLVAHQVDGACLRGRKGPGLQQDGLQHGIQVFDLLKFLHNAQKLFNVIRFATAGHGPGSFHSPPKPEPWLGKYYCLNGKIGDRRGVKGIGRT